MNYHIIFVKAEEGGYCSYLAGVEGINWQGETIDEARQDVIEAYNLMVDCDIEEAKEIPNSFVKSFVVA